MTLGRFSVAQRLTTLTVTLAAVGALVWTGCSSDNGSSYCDATGCYTCDGYGCSQVSPPPPKSCTTQTDCPTGQTCQNNKCGNPCQTNSDCAVGKVCSSGSCVPAPDAGPGDTGTGDATPDTNTSCTASSQCPAGQECWKSACITCGGSSGPCPCASNTDCSNGNVCAGGECTPPVDTCKYTSDCAANKVCANNQCVPGCDAMHACAQGFMCVSGSCQPNPTNNCTSNAQCPGGMPLCVGGQCSAGCTMDSQCPMGDYCNQGACVLDTRPQPECTNTSQCMSNQSCVDFYCRYTCMPGAAGDQQCKPIDARIGYCGVDGVCRTQAEAHPQCTQQSDCPSGQSCVSNVCQ